MRKLIILAIMLVMGNMISQAQELYVFAEPASNMPARSIATKLNVRLADADKLRQRYSPEIMFGLSKNFMLHASTTVSDLYSEKLRWESVKLYGKYRFYSQDEVHDHFRMAAFADVSYSRNDMIYEEMTLDGDNTGVQAGIIATKLVRRFAVSGTASYMKTAFKGVSHHGMQPGTQGLAYSLSGGLLVLPKSYDNYEQTNLNIYVEMLGMHGLDKGGDLLDVAPALQLIFNSNTKLNVGGRFQVAGNMTRVARNNYFIGIERTFLNALKKKK